MNNKKKRGGRGRPSSRYTPTYTQYLRSERWKVKKQAYYDKHGKYCKACGTRRGPIEVHHRNGYDRLGYERMSDLVSLCQPCHREVHHRHRRGGRKEHIRIVTDMYIAEKKRKR